MALVEQLGETLAAQRARVIRLPAWAVPAAQAMAGGHADGSAELIVASERVTQLAPGPGGAAGGCLAAAARIMESSAS